LSSECHARQKANFETGENYLIDLPARALCSVVYGEQELQPHSALFAPFWEGF
jgi:hypothetical protein